ncbi:MAG: DUF1697 domain-containing protein [Verrucomicrobiota bacterium JB022]|nr:DUF1697 domain-containing protein [Verrucomicrobiota bacterium JB022]
METYVAWLRGINVGGANKLPMKELQQLLTELGLLEVKTYIQSGNAAFRAAEADRAVLEQRITEAIRLQYEFTPQVMVLTAGQLEEAARRNPFPEAEADHKTLHLSFLAATPTEPELDKLEAVRGENERFQLIDRVFYLHAPGGIGRSKLAERVERCLGVPATSRNWRTVCQMREIVAKM